MKIMLGYDGSKASRRALDVLVPYAEAFSAEVCVFMAVEGGSHAVREVYEKAQADLASAKKTVSGAGLRCETKLSAQGLDPGEEMVEFARDQSIDLIVIGIKKQSKVGKLIFGSNAQYVILNAHCPVLTVHR